MSDSPTSRRRSIRLPDHDYSHPGIYFVTICVQDHRCLFGDVVNCELGHNNAGHMVSSWWNKLPQKFPHVVAGRIHPDAEPPARHHSHHRHCSGRRAATWGRPYIGYDDRVVQIDETNDYIRGVRDQGWPSFDGRLWQRNYYEHVVRGESDLDSIRNDIMANPDKWPTDPENPAGSRSRRQAAPWEI
jgi:REP element-mobilizing transposase RayT